MKRCPKCGSACLPAQAFCPACGTPLSTAALIEGDPYVGAVFAHKYLVHEKVGEGGMGAVYKASTLDVGRTVALKIMHERYFGDHLALKRFEREAKLASALDHPNSIVIFDFGHTPAGVAYMAMEFLTGETLADRLTKGRLPLQQALHIFRQILSVLQAAHSLGIVHRDLKPGNIFLTTRGETRDFVKVLDFGVARSRREQGRDRITRAGMVAGTPEYMSPEQARGEEQDARSDIYSAGVIFYEMITGTRPFEGRSPAEIMAAHIQEEPEPPSQRVNTIPPSLDAIVLWALAKDPNERIPSAREFQDVLEKWMEVTDIAVSEAGFCVRCSRPLTEGQGPLCSRCAASVRPEEVRPVPASAIVSEEEGHGRKPSTSEPTASSASRIEPASLRRRRSSTNKLLAATTPTTKVAYVGRRQQLGSLERLLVGGGCHILRFVGPTGVGRTRTALELLGRIGAEGWRTVVSPPASWNVRQPLEVIQAMAADLLELPCQPMAPEDVLESESTRLVVPAEHRDGLLDLFGLRDDPPQSLAEAVERRQARAEAWRSLVLESAEQRPLALFVDDLERLDGASRELVLALATVTTKATLAILLAHGESFVALWPGHVRTVEIGPLDPAETRELAETFARGALPTRVLREIVQDSEGNPLLLRERFLFRWFHPVDDLPPRLPDLVSSRAFRLPPDTHRILQLASVAGPVVTEEFLLALEGRESPPSLVEEAVEELLVRGFLVKEAGEMRFSHEFHREVIRSGIPSIVRQEYHLRAGRLAESFGAPEEETAYHLREGGSTAESVEILLRIGQRALNLLAEEEAELAFGRALTALKQPDATLSGRAGRLWLEAIEGMAATLCRAGRSQEAIEAVQAAVRRAERIEWHHAAASLRALLARIEASARDP